jgi:signal transduction histidine kinase
VKATIEAHGGSVVVTSRPGEGSRFSLRLPAGAADAETQG